MLASNVLLILIRILMAGMFLRQHVKVIAFQISSKTYYPFSSVQNSRKVIAKSARMTHVSSKDIPKILSNYMQNEKKLALLLDYDGTLTPITTHPDLATIPDLNRELLNRLSNVESIFLAIISGRAVNNVKKLVGLDHLHYAGNHGFEILNPDGSLYIHEIPEEYQIKLKTMIDELNKDLATNGAWVEDKTYSITYHFRSVPKEQKESYETRARAIMEKSGFRITHAHYGLEAKPPINWNKGTAALQILETHYGKNWQNETKVLFIGDDTTDEDAMEALKGHALNFRISVDPNVETHADYVIASPDDVVDILRWLDQYYC